MKDKIKEIFEKNFYGFGGYDKDSIINELDLLFKKQRQEDLISFLNWYKDDPKEISNNITIVTAYSIDMNGI